MKISVGTIVRVNEKGWRAWHNPPVGLIGVVVEVCDSSTYAIDFYESGWHNGHDNRRSLHRNSVWNMSFREFDIIEELAIANISELFEEDEV